MPDIGSMLSGAFAQLRERPVAVAVWAAIQMLVSGGFSLAFSFILLRWLDPARLASEETDPFRIWASFFSPTFLGLAGVAYFITILVMLVLTTAAMRATLRPADTRLAYLRIGMDEVRVVVVNIAVMLALFVVFMIWAAALFTMYRDTILAAFQFDGSDMSDTLDATSVAGLVSVSIGTGLIMFGVMIYISIRTSLIAPVTMIRRRLAFAEGWAAAKGHFWTLFLAYLVLYLIFWVASVVAGSILAAGGLSGAVSGLETLTQGEAANPGITSLMVANSALSGALNTLWIALFGGAAATAARAVIPDGAGIASEFE
jgi:hypothetical protein